MSPERKKDLKTNLIGVALYFGAAILIVADNPDAGLPILTLWLAFGCFAVFLPLADEVGAVIKRPEDLLLFPLFGVAFIIAYVVMYACVYLYRKGLSHTQS